MKLRPVLWVSGNGYFYRRLRRHLMIAAVAIAITGVVYFLSPGEFRHRLSMGTAYAGLAFIGGSLWLGPWNVIRRRPNPVSFDLRRDVGIWAAILAILHTAVGLTVHLRGRMWMYFVKGFHPLRLQSNQFGWANYLGLIAVLLFAMLLAISNDMSLRGLGTRKWKQLQRWAYLAAALTVAHGVLFQTVEKRHLMWVGMFYGLTVVVVMIQIAGFVLVVFNRQARPDKRDRLLTL
jgi:methionine sulfoxide reductase heme-binding subunit